MSRSFGLLAAVCAVTLLCTVGMAMPYPILAPIFVEGPADGFTHFGGMAPEWLLGVALAVNPAGILLGSLVLGPLSDRLGRRRVLVGSLLACAAGTLLTAAALDARLYPLFLVARFATGLTEGNVAVARALLADHHGEQTRVKAFAWLNEVVKEWLSEFGVQPAQEAVYAKLCALAASVRSGADGLVVRTPAYQGR